MVSTAFWASLLREEGRSPRVSLAFVSPEQSARAVRFVSPFPLEPDVLAHLAASVERPGNHVGIWPCDDHLCVWGVTRTIPVWCFVLEVVAPGLVVVKYRRPDPSTKFANVAVLQGADIRFIEREPAMISEPPPVLGSLFSFYSSAGLNEADNFLIRVATSMRAYGRGGSLLVVPSNTTQWHNSIVQPMTYCVNNPIPGFETGNDGDDSSSKVQSAVDALTGLTAVDGATVISDQFEPLAFGVKITSRDGARRVEQVLLTEPIEDVRDITIDPARLGGTRHLSAAQFAHDQRNAVALVASQDGRFTTFAWSSAHQIVHAHRLEALLI